MRYPFLAASLFCSVSLFAHCGLPHHQSGTLFSSSDLEDIQQNVPEEDDLIVLIDGTKLSGKVTKLPQLPFVFGKVSLNISDAAAIAFSHKRSQPKVQVLTKDAGSFVCDIPEGLITLAQSYPSQGGSGHTINQEINSHTINYILLKNENTSFSRKMAEDSSLRSHCFLSLELKNGDQLPIVVQDEAIQLSNGWRDFTLPADKIVDVSFDGGLYGVIEVENGNEEKLDFAFVKDKFLRIQIAKSRQMIGIPWNYVLSISRIKAISKKQTSVGFVAQKPPELGNALGAVVPSQEKVKQRAPEPTPQVESSRNDNFTVAKPQKAPEPTPQIESFRNDNFTVANLHRDTHKQVDYELSLDTAEESEQLLALGDVESKRQLLTAERERDQFKEKYIELSNKNRDSEGQLAELSRKSQDFHKQVEALSEMSENYQQELNNLHGVNHFLETKNQELTSELGSFLDAKEELLKTQDALQETKQTAETYKNKIATLNEDLDARESGYNQYKSQQNTAQQGINNKVRILTETLAKEKSESDSLRSRLQDMAESAEAFDKQLIALQDSVLTKKEEVEQLNGSYSILYTSLMKKVDLLINEKNASVMGRTETERLKEDFNYERNRSVKLEEQLATMTDKANAFEDKLKSLNKTFLTKQNEVEEARETQTAICEDLIGQINTLATNLKKESKQTAILREELEQALASREGAEKEKLDLTQALRKGESYAASLEKELDDRTNQLSEKGQQDTIQEERLAGTLEELQSGLSDEKNANASLRFELENAIQAQEKGSLKQSQTEQQLQTTLVRLAAMGEETEEVRNQLRSREEELSLLGETNDSQSEKNNLKIRDFEVSLEQQQQENEQLQGQLQVVKELNVTLQDEAAQQQQALNETNEKYDSICQKMEIKLAQAKKDLKHLNSQNKGEAEELKLALQEKNEELQNLTNRHSQVEGELAEQIDHLSKAQKKEQKRVKGFQEHIQSLELEKDNSLQLVGTHEQELFQLKEQIGAKDSSLEMAEKNLEEKQQDLEAFSQSHETQQKENAEQVKALTDRLNTALLVQNELQNERVKRNELQEQLQQMIAQLDETHRALSSAKEQNILENARTGTLLTQNEKLERERGVLQTQLKLKSKELFKQKELVVNLTRNLRSQKEALKSIEQNHLNLVNELESARTAQINLIQELSEDKPDLNDDVDSFHSSTTPQSSYRNVHIVQEGENLNTISMKYYNTSQRWFEIYEANRDVISDVNQLHVGTAVIIPD